MQDADAALLAAPSTVNRHSPVAVASLAQLEQAVEAAGSSIVVIAFYSRVTSFLMIFRALPLSG